MKQQGLVIHHALFVALAGIDGNGYVKTHKLNHSFHLIITSHQGQWSKIITDLALMYLLTRLLPCHLSTTLTLFTQDQHLADMAKCQLSPPYIGDNAQNISPL
jgi:hypothetical protein